MFGESLYGGGDIARHVAVQAGMSHVPGLAMNRHCASGLAAVQNAAASIRSGMDRVMVAGGTQSSSTMPRTKRRMPGSDRSEEHTSELQSLMRISYAVFCLKKKNKQHDNKDP